MSIQIWTWILVDITFILDYIRIPNGVNPAQEH